MSAYLSAPCATARGGAGDPAAPGALVDVDRGQAIKQLPRHPRVFEQGSKRTADQIWTPGVTADGRTLVTGSKDGTVKLWSLPDGRPIRTMHFTRGVSDAQLSPDGHWLSIQALTRDVVQDRLEIGDVRRNRAVHTLRPTGGVNFGRFSPSTADTSRSATCSAA